MALDGSVPDEELTELIDHSYEQVVAHSPAAVPGLDNSKSPAADLKSLQLGT